MPAVQTASGTASAPAAFPGAVTVGNTIIVAVTQLSSGGGIPGSVTDSRGNSYTLRASSRFAEDFGFGVSIWSAPITTGGSCTITVAGAATNVDLEGMLFASNQIVGAIEMPGEAVFEQADRSYDHVSDTGEGSWEDGVAPNIGPTAALTTASNLSVAVLLPMIFGGGDTEVTTPAGWTSIALEPDAEGIGGSVIQREFASTASPSVTWSFVANGSGSRAFWQAAMANFRLPDAGPEPQPVAPGEVAGGETFGGFTVGRGAAPAATPGAIAAVESFGSLAVGRGPAPAIAAGGLLSAATFGHLVIGRGAAPAAAPGAIATAEGFGSLAVGRGPAPAIAAGGFAPPASFGDLAVGRGAAPAIAPGTVDAAASFGVFSISASAEVAPGSVAPAASFGDLVVGRGAAPAVSPSAIGSAAMFGGLSVGRGSSPAVTPGVVVSGTTFGTIGAFVLDPSLRPSLAQLVVVEAPSRVLELPAPDRILVVAAPDRIIVIPGDPP